jgi:cyclopropane-fatty-acyl-phospholipid synthase
MAAIQHHYDVGNEFYQYWLGDTLTYSGALWAEGEAIDSLDRAQLRKIDYHLHEARAGKGARLLDVGCGWGSTLRRAVETHGVGRGVGLTLSQAQADWITTSPLRSPNVEIRVEDWREHAPAEPYDAIVSIGAFEHFSKAQISGAEKIANYRAFFDRCAEWLSPGGWLSLQSIGYGNPGLCDKSQFIENDIFPESDLPTLAEIATASDGRFEIVKVCNDRDHYARTIRAWLARLKENRTAMSLRFGEAVVDRYIKYLSLFVIGFHVGAMNLWRLSMRRYDRLQAPAAARGAP